MLWMLWMFVHVAVQIVSITASNLRVKKYWNADMLAARSQRAVRRAAQVISASPSMAAPAQKPGLPLSVST